MPHLPFIWYCLLYSTSGPRTLACGNSPVGLVWNTVRPPPSSVSALPRLAEPGASHMLRFTLAVSAWAFLPPCQTERDTTRRIRGKRYGNQITFVQLRLWVIRRLISFSLDLLPLVIDWHYMLRHFFSSVVTRLLLFLGYTFPRRFLRRYISKPAPAASPGYLVQWSWFSIPLTKPRSVRPYGKYAGYNWLSANKSRGLVKLNFPVPRVVYSLCLWFKASAPESFVVGHWATFAHIFRLTDKLFNVITLRHQGKTQ